MIQTGLSKEEVTNWIENLKLPAKLYAVLIDDRTLVLHNLIEDTPNPTKENKDETDI